MPSIFLHQDENIQPFGKLSLGPEQVFQEQDLTDRKYSQWQIGGKLSIGIVNHTFKATDRFSEYRPPVARPGAAVHGQDCPQVPGGKRGEAPSAPRRCTTRSRMGHGHFAPRERNQGERSIFAQEEKDKNLWNNYFKDTM